MTLMIADDEELIRFTIRDMLKDCGLEFSRIDEASTGSQLISSCRKNPPDIALVDIRMPGKTGLEAIEELQDSETVWIILTGHADFDYARKALQLGADDYLLKPPSPEEIGRVVNNAVSKIKERLKKKQQDFARKLTWVFNNTSAPEFDPLFSEAGIWSGWIVCLDSSLTEKDALKVQMDYSRAIRDEYLPSLPAGLRGALTTMDDGRLLITLFRKGEVSVQNEVVSPPDRNIYPEKERVYLSCSSTGISGSFNDYLKRLKALNPLLPLRFISRGIDPDVPQRGDVLAYCEELENLVLLTGTSRKEERDNMILEIIEKESPLSQEEEEILCRILQKIIPELPGKKRVKEQFEAYRDSRTEAPQDRQSVLVQQALRIVREEYSRDIGVAQIAYQLQVTPNYLSSLFRKQEGIPFTRYITEIRMNRARILLKETSLNIKEIASEVGYQSSRHFSGLFRQETGLSPTEYIRQYRV